MKKGEERKESSRVQTKRKCEPNTICTHGSLGMKPLGYNRLRTHQKYELKIYPKREPLQGNPVTT